MPDRRYSDTGLKLMQWHLSVMHDRHAPLFTRIEAAAELLRIWPEQFPDTYQLTPVDLTYFIDDQGMEDPDTWPSNHGPKLVGHA